MSSSTRTPDSATSLPLVSLLGRAEDAFIHEFDQRIGASEFCALSLAHSRNVLRHLGAEARRASQVVERCGVSKQAVSQQISHLERNGYLTVEPDPTDQRARMLRLTPKGERAQRLVRRLFRDIERDWDARVGDQDAAALRRALATLLDETDPPSGSC